MISKLAGFNIFGSQQNEPEKSEVPQEIRTTRARQQVIHAIETRLNERRTFGEKVADALVRWFGNFRFALLNLLFFAGWIGTNLGYVPGVQPFDPPPFIMLINVVSLEAIFLSIFVLISQNREAKTSDLREEIDLQVNMIAEQEITKIIHLLAGIMKHLNISYEKDPELKRMMRPLNTEEIRGELENQLGLPHQQQK
ncbi:MAG: DUF1003 domain-containing protein [Candidatus Sungiibacteriota bacterium]